MMACAPPRILRGRSIVVRQPRTSEVAIVESDRMSSSQKVSRRTTTSAPGAGKGEAEVAGTDPPGRLTCQSGLHSPQAALYCGHPSRALAIPGPFLPPVCAVSASLTGQEQIGSLGRHVFGANPSY